MKAPICRLCEHAHWNNEPHVFDARATCNQCVTKDAEIQRLRNQIALMQPKPPKRDRAAYMREYRKS